MEVGASISEANRKKKVGIGELERVGPDPVEEIEKIIAGVLVRRVILRTLLSYGPQTGPDLRWGISKYNEIGDELFRNQMYWTLKDSFDRRINGVSDALLYFNLKHLEITGLIIRERSELEYKSKVARINPLKIQLIRQYFRDIIPLACISGFDFDDDKWRLTRLYQKLRRTKLLYNQGIDEGMNFTILPEGLKSKISAGIPRNQLFEIPLNKMSYIEVYNFLRRKIEDLLQTHDVIINVTLGSRFFTIALTQIAFEYNLKIFYLDPQENIIWIKD
ncbi:MAG: hypothetical protein HWN65_01875 [Candidatus Helarchaeota archaeon]|nr:hypothetical protein [Candidatus Helarchaeota archaeon]